MYSHNPKPNIFRRELDWWNRIEESPNNSEGKKEPIALPSFIQLSEWWEKWKDWFSLSRDTIIKILFDINLYKEFRAYLRAAHKNWDRNLLLNTYRERSSLDMKDSWTIMFWSLPEYWVITSMIETLRKDKNLIKKLTEVVLKNEEYEDIFIYHCLSILTGDTAYFNELYDRFVVKGEFGQSPEIPRMILQNVNPEIALAHLKKYPDKNRDTVVQNHESWSNIRATEWAPSSLRWMNKELLGIINSPNYHVDTKTRAIQTIMDWGNRRWWQLSAIQALNSIIYKDPPIWIKWMLLENWNKEWDKLKDAAKVHRDHTRPEWYVPGTNINTGNVFKQWPL